MKQIKVHGYSSLMSLNELFEGRFFEIPDYQRGYSWEKQQLEDLTQDIVNMFNKQHMHFTGTIVAAQKNKKVNTFDIVDGQQRLTTLIILVKEIINQHNDKYGHLVEKFIKGQAIKKILLEVGKQNEEKVKSWVDTQVNTWMEEPNFFQELESSKLRRKVLNIFIAEGIQKFK